MLKRKQLKRLQSRIRGAVLTPDDDVFTRIGNLRGLKQVFQDAQVIVQPYDAEDVVASICFVQEVNIGITVRGGGGHPAGLAVGKGGLLLDMSTLKSMQVNPADKWAITQTGITWGEFDQVTQAFGLACTGASVPNAGIAGQTLSGGIGWLHRCQGLTSDHVISAEMATAEGTLINVSEEENPELLWALKGAGRHFGVVTSIAYQLTTLDPMMLGGYVTYPLDKLGDLAAHHQSLARNFPDALSTWIFAGYDETGMGVCRLAMFYAGNPNDGEKWYQKLISFSPPISNSVRATTYLAWQGGSALGPYSAPARCWHSLDIGKVSPGLVELFQSSIANAPKRNCKICVVHLGGVLRRRVDELSAAAPINAENRVIILGDGQAAEDTELCVNWADQLRESLLKLNSQLSDPGFSGANVPLSCLYTNVALERLKLLKASFDPGHLFGSGL